MASIESQPSLSTPLTIDQGERWSGTAVARASGLGEGGSVCHLPPLSPCSDLDRIVDLLNILEGSESLCELDVCVGLGVTLSVWLECRVRACIHRSLLSLSSTFHHPPHSLTPITHSTPLPNPKQLSTYIAAQEV